MQKHNTVDLVTLSPDARSICLVMVETRRWDKRGKHLSDLRSKVGHYLEYVRTGQLERGYGVARGRPVVLRLHTRHRPPPDVLAYIASVKAQVAGTMVVDFDIMESN
jgi:hypothetical protein